MYSNNSCPLQTQNLILFVRKNFEMLDKDLELKSSWIQRSPKSNNWCPFKKKFESISLSVMSDSLGPHGLQHIRLLCPWTSPGKNTGEGCHSLLQEIFPVQGWNSGLLHCRQVLYQLRGHTSRERRQPSDGRPRLEACTYKLRNDKDCQVPPESGRNKEAFFWGLSEALRYLDFRI